jgi:hypothetical protein
MSPSGLSTFHKILSTPKAAFFISFALISSRKNTTCQHTAMNGLILCIAIALPFAAQSQDIQLHYDSAYSLNFNKAIPIGFEVTNADGQKITTKGFLNGKASWGDFNVQAAGCVLNKDVLYIGGPTGAADDHIIQLAVTYKPWNIIKTVLLTLRFDGVLLALYKPAKAEDRSARGERIIHRILIFTRDGKPGYDGRKGADGPNLKVNLLTKTTGSDTLLGAAVTIINTAHTDTFYINPRLGQIKISADGGDGGNGGDGGPGCGVKSNASDGGSGGDGGNGGRGGMIEVKADSITEHWLGSLVFSNEGGTGGSGGHGGKGGKAEKGTATGSSGRDGNYGASGADGYMIVHVPRTIPTAAKLTNKQ